jgi:hypothetical protein
MREDPFLLPRCVPNAVRCGAMDVKVLADIKLPDADGAMHRLGDTWRDRPIVLVFLRHFG